MLLEVSADLGRQQDAGSGAEFAVLLVEFALQHQLLEIHEGHGDGGLLEAALVLGQLPDLSLQAAAHTSRRQTSDIGLARVHSTTLRDTTRCRTALPPDLAQRQANVRELLLERLVHVLLQVGGLDVLDNRGLHGSTKMAGDDHDLVDMLASYLMTNSHLKRFSM